MGDIFDLDDWYDMVETGMLIDYDGYGHALNINRDILDDNGKIASGLLEAAEVYPSRPLPPNTVYIQWYNK